MGEPAARCGVRLGIPAERPVDHLRADRARGHSYAGFLISDAAAQGPAVKALVYVAAYIPEAGESPADLTYKFPGSELQGSNLVTRPEPGGTDIYINPADFASVYAGGLSRAQVAIASVVQRPITATALGEATTVDPPAATPKWKIVALQDNAIPTKAEFFMAPVLARPA